MDMVAKDTAAIEAPELGVHDARGRAHSRVRLRDTVHRTLGHRSRHSGWGVAEGPHLPHFPPPPAAPAAIP